MEKNQPDPDNLALESVERISSKLLSTYKKISFYSESHSVYLESLGPFYKSLTDYIKDFGNIRFKIEPYRFVFEGTVIHEGKSEPGELAFILHRDGIKWLEFKDGLEQWEIDTLIKTFNDCRHLEADAEDDIATILWSLKLQSIDYETIDTNLDHGDDIDFEALQCFSPAQTESTDENRQDAPGIESSESDAPDTAAPPEFKVQDKLYILTAEEKKQLEEMISDEEKLDGSDYVIDVFLHIIERHLLSEEIDMLLEDITHAFKEALLSIRFAYLSVSMKKIKKQIEIFRSSSHWSIPHLERFLSSLSSETFLLDLSTTTHKPEYSDPSTIEELKNFLLLLDADVIGPLTQIMMECQSDKLRGVFQEIIILIAKKDFRPMKKLLFGQDKPLAGHLIFILRFLKDRQSHNVLIKLLRDDSELIRKQALRTLFVRHEQAGEDIFFLIDDPDKMIRSLFLRHLARERNNKTEQLLLGHLTSNPASEKDPGYFKAVCTTLGKCGSDESLPYLKKLLFKWPRVGILRYGNSIRRQGADIALKALGTVEANQLIKRSQNGFLKNIFRPV